MNLDNIKVIVFDFDGTLMYTNELKYNGFFKLFPDDEKHKRAVKTVLDDILEESRYVILKGILELLGENAEDSERINSLADAYNDIVLEGAKSAEERDNAGEVLKSLWGKYILYVSSNGPEDTLKKVLEHKQWTSYFKGIYGYPKKKAETLRNILADEMVSPSEVIVIGDGKSDELSAVVNSCGFYNVNTIKLTELG